jgi:membrane protein DedA with SNARE-associated domain
MKQCQVDSVSPGYLFKIVMIGFGSLYAVLTTVCVLACLLPVGSVGPINTEFITTGRLSGPSGALGALIVIPVFGIGHIIGTWILLVLGFSIYSKARNKRAHNKTTRGDVPRAAPDE